MEKSIKMIIYVKKTQNQSEEDQLVTTDLQPAVAWITGDTGNQSSRAAI